jgi:hypothetical protein
MANTKQSKEDLNTQIDDLLKEFNRADENGELVHDDLWEYDSCTTLENFVEFIKERLTNTNN